MVIYTPKAANLCALIVILTNLANARINMLSDPSLFSWLELYASKNYFNW